MQANYWDGYISLQYQQHP